jgi:putative alpha-1,2-mannosidase
VFNAIGLYTYSPADPQYIVTVPLFDKVVITMSNGNSLTISKRSSGEKITDITYAGQKANGYFISHRELLKGKELVITAT